MSETSSKKRKLSLPLVLAGGVSSLVLALGMSPTFSAFSASITNSLNTAGAGTLVMQETDASNTECNSNDGATPALSLATNTATCISINKYGGKTAMVPGQIQTTTVTIKNTGTITPTSFTLAPQGCTQALGTPNGGATDACTKFIIKVYAGATATDPVLNAVGEQTASTFATALSLTPLAPQGTQQYTFSVQLVSTVSNAYQGITITQPLVWTFQT